MSLSAKLRAIAGQDTDPPLWIWVAKDQIGVLVDAADRLDQLEALYAAFTTLPVCTDGSHRRLARALLPPTPKGGEQ